MALDLAAPHPDEAVLDPSDKRRAAATWYRFFLLIASSLNSLSRSLTSTISDLAALTIQEAADIAAVEALIPGFASQAQQETGSDTATIVAPGTQKYHAAHPKAQGRFDSNGTLVGVSFGVESVSRTGTGNFSVTLSAAMADTGYGVLAVSQSGSGTLAIPVIGITSSTVFTVNFLNAAGTGVNVGAQFAVFGDLP